MGPRGSCGAAGPSRGLRRGPGWARGPITKVRKSCSSRSRYRSRSKAGPWVSERMAPAAGGRGQHRGPRTDRNTGAGDESGWSGRPSEQGPGEDSHHRGRSTAPRAGELRGRRPRGSGRPGAGAGLRRSMAAPGGGKQGQRRELVGQTSAREACTPRGKRAVDDWAKRPGPIPARCPGCPAAGRAHLGVAADAARRVSAGLGVHAQGAGPVEVQAAGAGLQESQQVLVNRVFLRWPGRQQSQPEKGTIWGPLRNHVCRLQGW